MKITCLADLAEALKQARLNRKLTQEKVSSDLKIGRTWLNNVENGTTLDDPGFNRILRLASYYNLTFEVEPQDQGPTLDDIARSRWPGEDQPELSGQPQVGQRKEG